MFSNVKDIFYKTARCGMYHSMQIDLSFVINDWLDGVFSYFPKGLYDVSATEESKKWHPRLDVNPIKLIELFKNHFSNYIGQLKDVNNANLREKFVGWYDNKNAQFLNNNRQSHGILYDANSNSLTQLQAIQDGGNEEVSEQVDKLNNE